MTSGGREPAAPPCSQRFSSNAVANGMYPMGRSHRVVTGRTAIDRYDAPAAAVKNLRRVAPRVDSRCDALCIRWGGDGTSRLRTIRRPWARQLSGPRVVDSHIEGRDPMGRMVHVVPGAGRPRPRAAAVLPFSSYNPHHVNRFIRLRYSSIAIITGWFFLAPARGAGTPTASTFSFRRPGPLLPLRGLRPPHTYSRR
jgi:hypothetical protein